jgi:hypothetical protein
MAIDTHKGRATWTHWHGTPSRVAEIAREAVSQVSVSGRGAVTIALVAPAWESRYDSVEGFEEGIRAPDLPDVRTIEISAESPLRDRRISLTVRRPTPVSSGPGSSSRMEPAAELSVAGEDREWVSSATGHMRERVAAGTPDQRWPRWFLFVGFPFGLAGLIVLASTQVSPIHQVALACAIGGGVLFVTAVGSMMFTPYFEFVPDGHVPRRRRLANRARTEGTWLARQVVGGLSVSCSELGRQCSTTAGWDNSPHVAT